jgi:hypothetical protein
MRTTQGLSHDTWAQCEPRLGTIRSGTGRREGTHSLPSQLQTAATLGLDQGGWPISADPIASLFGFAQQHGGGERKAAGRMALRLPAFCGAPTREEAQQVLAVSVAQPQAIPAPCPSLPPQRREVWPHPDALERLSTAQASIHVERIPGATNRSNDQEIVNVSNSYQKIQGLKMHRQDADYLPASAVS